MNSTKAMATSRNPSEDDFQHPIQDPEPISEDDLESNMNIDSDDVDNHSTSSNSPSLKCTQRLVENLDVERLSWTCSTLTVMPKSEDSTYTIHLLQRLNGAWHHFCSAQI